MVDVTDDDGSGEVAELTDQPFLLWLDFETTGLSVEEDLILEVAGVVTSANYPFQELDSFQCVVGDYRDGEEDPWLPRLRAPGNEPALEMHLANGLVEELVLGPMLGVQHAEQALINMVDRFVKSDQRVTLAGAGVSHFDRRVIRLRMSRLEDRLTYWDFDTSVTWRVLERTSPRIVEAVDARMSAEDAGYGERGEEAPWSPAHRAMPDVLNAIRWANHLGSLEPRG